MKILVTGSSGFIGQHLVRALKRRGHEVLLFDRENTGAELLRDIEEADAICHLAGENRPKNLADFEYVNHGLTETICSTIRASNKQKRLLFASSIQADLNNPYGVSKKEAEVCIEKLAKETNTLCSIFRLPNVFGKGCRPFYNSVVATWCYQIARGEEMTISNPSNELHLIYVCDVVDAFVNSLDKDKPSLWPSVSPVYDTTLGELNKLIHECADSRKTSEIPVQEGLSKKMYATYISYIPEDAISYEIKVAKEPRGSFNEIIRLKNMGQVSINVIAPHKIKGGHYHETKIEKFVFLTGHCIYRMYPAGKPDQVTSKEILCDGDNYIVIDVTPGYFHEIENVGEVDAITLIWASEEYTDLVPDTYRD